MAIVDCTTLGTPGARYLNTETGAELEVAARCAYCGTGTSASDEMLPPSSRKRCRSCGAPVATVEHRGETMSVEEARSRGLWPRAARRRVVG